MRRELIWKKYYLGRYPSSEGQLCVAASASKTLARSAAMFIYVMSIVVYGKSFFVLDRNAGERRKSG